MTQRERIRAILGQKAPDRIPWIPRIEIWYTSMQRTGRLPDRYRGKTLDEIRSDLGIGDPARGGSVFSLSFSGVEVESCVRGDEHIVKYHTPIGELQETTVRTKEHEDNGVAGTKTEHLLKGPKDYPVWEYIVERSEYSATYAEYTEYDEGIGERGCPIVPSTESPCYLFLEDLAGFKSAYYQLADFPKEVSHLFDVMAEVYRSKAWPVIAKSPAEIVLTGAHLSSQLTPPELYENHILQYTADFNRYLKQHGKKTALHGDDDTRAIFSHIRQSQFDMVECFVTSPMVPTTLRAAREAWGTDIVIWGGIPASILEPSFPFDEFKRYVADIFEVIAPGHAFILGVADNVMPTSDIERIRWVSDYVESTGWFPVSV